MMNCNSNNYHHLNEISQGTISRVGENDFCTTIIKNDERIFLRMELLTPENTDNWSLFQNLNYQVANSNGRGVLSTLVLRAGKDNYPDDYEKMKEYTGFTREEYEAFTRKAIKLKKTNEKITKILASNSVGSAFMCTNYKQGELRYIVYASKNPNFSIQEVKLTSENFSLKNYIEAYSDILISVGSNFSYRENAFHNRGISRNPYWVFEEKYSGLSMLLHGFSAAVANQFFPQKQVMCVKPVGSMQDIIKKNLLLGEGTLEDGTDITQLQVSQDDEEGLMNHIQVVALTRIYNQIMATTVV